MDGRPPPTEEQARAIGSRDRNVFCEAGAGSGKTRVLVDRYCDAVTEDGVALDAILAFTFTERAAAELRSRIRGELTRRARLATDAGATGRAGELRGFARDTEGAWVTTIHGFCRRLLGTHAVAAGLDPRFRVLDAPEAQRLREQAAREALDALLVAGDQSVARTAAAYDGWRVTEIALIAHERLRNQGMTRPELPTAPEPIRSGGDDPVLTPAEKRQVLDSHAALQSLLGELSERYDALKGTRSGLDFADLELRAVALLLSSSAVAAAWQGRFRHVLVDEFQDTNRVQLDLIGLLRGPETRLFTVGDENQSVYRFRNADLEVFRAQRELAREGAADVLALTGNFRSRPEALAAANAVGSALIEDFPALSAGREPGGEPRAELLLTYQEGRGKKHLKWKDHAEALQRDPADEAPRRPQPPRSPEIVAEARALAERLRELVVAGEACPGEIVVLLRAFTHVDTFEEALRRFGLDPYVVGGRGYWSQQQVEDLLRLLETVANPLDDEMLFGALAGPGCQVSPDALWLLRRAAGRGHVWPVIANDAPADFAEREDAERAGEAFAAIPADDRERIAAFRETLAELRSKAPVLTLDTLVERTMNAFGYDLALLAKPQGAGRMANVRKLMRLASEFERNEGRDLRGFLRQAAASTKRDEREGLAPVQPEDHDGVRLMTVHGAKGLEFPVVAVPALGRELAAGHSWGNIWIGDLDDDGNARMGLRVASTTKETLKVWELEELEAEEKAAEAEETARLVYVAATRASERLILSGIYRPGDLEPLDDLEPRDTPLRRFLPTLCAAGWSGSEASLALPAPARVDTGEPASSPLLEIRVSSPSDERAAELRAVHPSLATSARPEPSSASPPILSGRPSPVPLGHLSYSALDSYKRCGYRFYAERVLGLGAPPQPAAETDGGEPPEAEPRAADELSDPDTPDPGVPSALGLGNAVHAALEWSARNSWADPGSDRLDALLSVEGVDSAGAVVRAGRLVAGWLESDLLRSLEGATLRPEAPFVLPLGPTMLRGSIDLLATGAETWVVDFKSDRIPAGGVPELGERYATQRAVYALAAAGVVTPGPIHTAHVFLERASEPVLETFDDDALERARSGLVALVERISAGHFEVTPEPYAALCFGCPAAARLCPHPKWRPRAAA